MAADIQGRFQGGWAAPDLAVAVRNGTPLRAREITPSAFVCLNRCVFTVAAIIETCLGLGPAGEFTGHLTP
jgi:hypothetical protein